MLFHLLRRCPSIKPTRDKRTCIEQRWADWINRGQRSLFKIENYRVLLCAFAAKVLYVPPVFIGTYRTLPSRGRYAGINIDLNALLLSTL